MVLTACLTFPTAFAQTPTPTIPNTYPDGIPNKVDLPPQHWQSSHPRLRIILAGASTVQPGSGWGPGFVDTLKPGVECLNLSKGERSTRTYREEGRWDQVLALKPDYVIVGLANNDSMKSRPQRYVTLDDFKVNIARFVSEARADGIKPVLMTALSAHRWNPDGTLKANGEPAPYNQLIRDVAAETDTPLLDVERISAAFYSAQGQAKIDALSPVKDGAIEGQHLNKQGGMVIGELMAQALKAQVPELAPYIR